MIGGGEAASEVGETIGMRCFESFFKHTWRPQQVHQVHQVHQMDPPSRFEPTTKKTAEVPRLAAAGETTELGEMMTVPSDGTNVATSMPSTAQPSSNDATTTARPCKNGGCKVWRSSRVGGGEPRTESPWHSLKTVFFISVIVTFLLWIIVYTLLDQYQIL